MPRQADVTGSAFAEQSSQAEPAAGWHAPQGVAPAETVRRARVAACPALESVPMTAERQKATMAGLLAALLLAGLIVLGSRNLARFDAALLAYTFATLFAFFGITYRWMMWLQRPATAMYWRRGARLLLKNGGFGRHGWRMGQRLLADFAGNRFIWRRGLLRGAAHLLIMWGCVTAFAITFPLVFGWVHFETVPGDLTRYRVHLFGLAATEFAIHSLFGFLLFHALVWSSLLVIAGVLLAMRRRLRDGGAAALQQFGEDFLPLVLLFAISATGLLLTVSYTWMRGYAYDFLAILHAVTVIFTLLWLPFGKLFHIFMRPAHLAVGAYKDAGREGEQAHCRRCGAAFASRMHVEDLIAVEKQLGYRYEIADAPARHYQWICPACRRSLVCLAHAALWGTEGEISPRRTQRTQRKDKKTILTYSASLKSIFFLCVLCVLCVLRGEKLWLS